MVAQRATAWATMRAVPTDKSLSLEQIRAYAGARSLFEPTTLGRAIAKLGFVQADPIRAPARAQDLTLRHRVTNYCAGDLERRYRTLAIEEGHFLNYGFLPRRHSAQLLPRQERRRWSRTMDKRATEVLTFVRERGEVHPSEVERHFVHGAVTNAWGGSSNATTQILSALHYRGALRVSGRDKGIRLYAFSEAEAGVNDANTRAWALLSIAVKKYAPLPLRSIGQLASRLHYAAPQLRTELRRAATRMAKELPHARIGDVVWYWPSKESPWSNRAGERWTVSEQVRFLAPFDPVVWDRERFEHLWGWPYRFEAYTPVPKRKFGYYALPLLWGQQVIGWANVSKQERDLHVDLGYVAGAAPKGRLFTRALDAEIERMRAFLTDV
jgi:uncharacterized protein